MKYIFFILYKIIFLQIQIQSKMQAHSNTLFTAGHSNFRHLVTYQWHIAKIKKPPGLGG
jgi:hypothetical protein